MFIEPGGVKINDAYYCDVLLGLHLLPAIYSTAADLFTFQQDNAPAHQGLLHFPTGQCFSSSRTSSFSNRTMLQLIKDFFTV